MVASQQKIPKTHAESNRDDAFELLRDLEAASTQVIDKLDNLSKSLNRETQSKVA